MTILVVAEHDGVNLCTATRNVVTAAKQIGGEIHVLVMGYHCTGVAEEAARMEGVQRVRKVDAPQYADQMVESLAMVVAQTASAYQHVLFAATVTGKNLAPRVAAMLDVGQVSDIVAVESADTFVRPIYAGNALARVQSDDPVKVVTIRCAAFPAVLRGLEADAAEIVPSPAGPDMGVSRLVARVSNDSARPELASARVVVAGGRGLGNRDNFHALLGPLADKLGAAIGATRAAVDANYVSNDLQIGQTGKVVAPELYIAVGLSGSIQHIAGMRNSRLIVAINKDPEAPIFKVADYGLVGDLNVIVPQLIQSLQTRS